MARSFDLLSMDVAEDADRAIAAFFAATGRARRIRREQARAAILALRFERGAIAAARNHAAELRA